MWSSQYAVFNGRNTPMSMSSYNEGSSGSAGQCPVANTFVLLLARGCRDVTARSLLCGRLFANGPEESKSDDVLMAALRFVAVPRGFDALFESLLVDMAIVRLLRLSKALR
jgi:hypothetical protein